MKKFFLFTLLLALFFSFNSFKKVYYGLPQEQKANQALDVISNEVAKNFNLEFLLSGYSFSETSENAVWLVSFKSSEKLTQKDSSIFVKQFMKTFLEKMRNNRVFNEYLKKSDNNSFSKRTFRDDLFALKLSFWDENMDRPLAPYIAQIRVADNNVYYYYADPKTQALQEPPITEPLSLNP